MQRTWKNYSPSPEKALDTAKTLLSEHSIWGRDLNEIPSLTELVSQNILLITEKGMRSAMKEVLRA